MGDESNFEIFMLLLKLLLLITLGVFSFSVIIRSKIALGKEDVFISTGVQYPSKCLSLSSGSIVNPGGGGKEFCAMN